MSSRSIPTENQKDKLTKLVDDLGVSAYRDTKVALGMERMKPFQKMTYTEAMQVIEFMESLKKEL